MIVSHAERFINQIVVFKNDLRVDHYSNLKLKEAPIQSIKTSWYYDCFHGFLYLVSYI